MAGRPTSYPAFAACDERHAILQRHVETQRRDRAGGRDEIRQLWTNFLESWEALESTTTFAQICVVEDGKISSATLYPNKLDALDASGSSDSHRTPT